MPNWMRKYFRDPPTSFATVVTAMSVVGVVSGAIFIARILLALRHG